MSKKEYYDKEYVSNLLDQQKHDHPKSNNSDKQYVDYFDRIQDACEKLNKDLNRQFDK